MRTLPKIVCAFTALLTLATATGVSASFLYAEDVPQVVSQDMGFNVGIFNWEGSEVLPDDVQGEDHQTMIDSILNSEAGLNTAGSYLNTQISNRVNSYWSWDTYGSMDVYDATQMASIFNTETNGLAFLLEFPEDEPDTQYLYTTSVDLGESGFLWNTGNNIPLDRYVYAVYRTILTRNVTTGKWEAEKTELGYAKSDWYDNNVLGSAVAKCPAFDPDTWTAGKQGTSTSDSIYAYVGQQTTAYVDSATEVAYYDLTPDESGTRTITAYNMDCTITITNASGTTVATSSAGKDANGDDVVSVSWNATRSTTYYIQISGDTSMTFTIT